MVNRFVEEIVTRLAELTGASQEEVQATLAEPPDLEMGDYAYPCFNLAKARGQNPAKLAQELAGSFATGELITEARAVGPYVNFFIDPARFAEDTLRRVYREREGFGRAETESGKTAVIEFSSPNICKPLHVGHLRGTAVGNAVANLLEAVGYQVVRLNYLGDWGTQFGQVITAWRRWGDEADLAESPIHHLVDLYQRFHREVAGDPGLAEEARQWFKRVEDGDPEALGYWKRFRELSLTELKQVYGRLGVRFDEIWGESDFNERMADSIEELRNQGLTTQSEGALIVDLSAEGMPPVLLLKRDGATLYHTREIASATYRWERFHFDKSIYVVGTPQKLHFRQLFRVLELMGHEWADRCVHVEFGHVHGLSTRKGNAIFLRELLNEAQSRALEKMRAEAATRPEIHDLEEVADQVGISALFFNDLASGRAKDVSFDWDRVLSFEGGSGVYLQYAHARVAGILRKCGVELTDQVNTSLLREPLAHRMARHLERFPNVVADAARLYEPSLVSQYLLELARLLSAGYNELRVKDEQESLAQARLLLLWSVKQVLANGLRLLGLRPLERM